MIRLEHHLMEFIGACIIARSDDTDRVVAGGVGVCRLLQAAHPEQHLPWRDGDVDIFVRAVDGSQDPYNYADGVLTDIRAFFDLRGYKVEVERSTDQEGMEYSEYGGSMLPLSAYPNAMPGAEFTDGELLQTIDWWLVEVAACEAQFATVTASGRTVLQELQRVPLHMPASRRPRRWFICQGGSTTMRVTINHTIVPELPPRLLNIIAMRPLTRADGGESELCMPDVAEDFDIAPCGVRIEGVQGGVFRFSGDPDAVTEARAGRRTLRLTSVAFEALLPRLLGIAYWEHPNPNSVDAERRRYHALHFSVNRQMRRIAKYLKRGFMWPEV